MGARKMIKKLFILVTVLCLCLTAGVRAEAPEAAGEAAEVTFACFSSHWVISWSMKASSSSRIN